MLIGTTLEIQHRKWGPVSASFSEYLFSGNHKVWLHNHKKEKPEFHVQDHRSWSGRGGPWYPQDFGRSVNPIQTRWSSYAHHITISLPPPRIFKPSNGPDIQFAERARWLRSSGIVFYYATTRSALVKNWKSNCNLVNRNNYFLHATVTFNEVWIKFRGCENMQK